MINSVFIISMSKAFLEFKGGAIEKGRITL